MGIPHQAVSDDFWVGPGALCLWPLPAREGQKLRDLFPAPPSRTREGDWLREQLQVWSLGYSPGSITVSLWALGQVTSPLRASVSPLGP